MRVVVAGAGIIGAAIASALARRGVDVCVVDVRPAGHGASRASAGILAPYTEAADDSPLLPLAIRSLAMYEPFIADATARSGRRIEFARSGTLQVAISEPEAEHLRASADWLHRRGVAGTWLDGAGVRAHEPVSRSVVGGLLVPDHGFVGVRSLVAALVQSARLSGATFESPVEASRIIPRAAGIEVRSSDRRLDADAVVIAAGSWSGRLRIDGVPALAVRPVRGQLLHLRWPVDERAPARVVWGAGCYAVPWSDGSVLVGATMEEAGFDEHTTVAGLSELSTAVVNMLPAAARAQVVDARAGLRPATPDGLPLLGPLGGNARVWCATGHFRNGILLAPLTAAIVERALLDGVEDEALAATRPDRFT